MLVETSGQCVGTAYVAFCYGDRETSAKMLQAIELVEFAARELPVREDLEMAARLLREADASLVAY
jgi:hypothetical protein